MSVTIGPRGKVASGSGTLFLLVVFYAVLLAALSSVLFNVDINRVGIAFRAAFGGGYTQIFTFLLLSTDGMMIVSVLLNALIAMVGFYGIIVTASKIARRVADERYASQFAQFSLLQKRQNIEAGGTLDLREMLDGTLINDPTGAFRTNRAFVAIHDAARDMHFDTPEFLASDVEDWLEDELARLQQRGRFAIQLGIFGTFLGLSRAIMPLSMMSKGATSDQLGRVFGELFSSLNTGFSSSIAGLLASFFIGGAVGIIRKRCLLLSKEFKESVQVALGVARRCNNQNVLTQEFRKITKTIEKQSAMLDDKTNSLLAKLEGVADTGKSFTSVKEELQSFGKSVTSGFESLKAVVEPESWRNQFEQALHAGIDGLAKVFEAKLQHIAEVLDESNAALAESRLALTKQVEASADASGNVSALIGNLQNNLDQRLSGPTAEEFLRAFRDLNLTMRKASAAMSKLEEAIPKTTWLGRAFSYFKSRSASWLSRKSGRNR